MKKQLENDLIIALMPFIADDNLADAKLAITMAIGKYDIAKSETALTVYEGDLNEVILKKFLSAKLAQGCSKKTIAFYRNSVITILEKIGKAYVDVTADDIRLYLAMRIYQDGVSKTTANNERRCLSSFYGWLQKEEILLKNPMTKVDHIKETKKKKQAFSLMDLEKIRYACRTARETALVEVLISTWCRVSEVAQIRIDDIVDNKLIAHGKGDKDREVYLNAKAVMALKVYLSERHDSNPYLFPRAKYAGDVRRMSSGVKRGQECEWYKIPEMVHESDHIDSNTIEGLIRQIGKRAGVSDTHPHRFRRTGATMALRQGMPLIQVSKILGHENIGTTQIYLDISDEELEQAHKKYVV